MPLNGATLFRSEIPPKFLKETLRMYTCGMLSSMHRKNRVGSCLPQVRSILTSRLLIGDMPKGDNAPLRRVLQFLTATYSTATPSTVTFSTVHFRRLQLEVLRYCGAP